MVRGDPGPPSQQRSWTSRSFFGDTGAARGRRRRGLGQGAGTSLEAHVSFIMRGIDPRALSYGTRLSDDDNRTMNAIITTTKAIVADLCGLPLVARWVVVGAAAGTVIGGIVGLVVGLYAYPPTAWFAVFEAGIPAGATGAIVGLLGALIVTTGRRVKRYITPSR
jgi:hypothetical protein